MLNDLFRSVLVPFVVALVTAVVASFVTEYFDPVIDSGKVAPIEPSVLCVARGIGQVDADHLIIPLDLQNTRNEPVLITQPYLELRYGQRPSPLSDKIFGLVGSYEAARPELFTEPYSYRTSIELPENSVTTNVLVFRALDYDDPRRVPRGTSSFSFSADRDYTAHLAYDYSTRSGDLDHADAKHLVKLDFPSEVDRLPETNGSNAACWNTLGEDDIEPSLPQVG